MLQKGVRSKRLTFCPWLFTLWTSHSARIIYVRMVAFESNGVNQRTSTWQPITVESSLTIASVKRT